MSGPEGPSADGANPPSRVPGRRISPLSDAAIDEIAEAIARAMPLPPPDDQSRWILASGQRSRPRTRRAWCERSPGVAAGLRGGARESAPVTASGRAAEADGPRQFTDADGRRWTVTEELTGPAEWSSAEAETHRAGYPVGWLVFECDTVRKRLRLFPARWRTLSDAALEHLCRRARASRPRE